MNPTIVLFSSIFTFSVISSSLLFLITKERLQMLIFLIAATAAFFLNQLYLATLLGTNQTLTLAYIFLSITVVAVYIRLFTSRYQLLLKCLLIFSIFGSLLGIFFF